MKLEINLDKKTIKLENEVNIGKFLTAIETMFPNDFKEFTLETGTKIVYHEYPIYRYHPSYSMWDRWYTTPGITYTSGTSSLNNMKGSASMTIGTNGSTTTTLEEEKTEAPMSGTFVVNFG